MDINVIRSKTYITAVDHLGERTLVVLPAQPWIVEERDYQKEAELVSRWLKGTFCLKTLALIKGGL